MNAVNQELQKFLINDSVKKEIDRWCLKYPKDQKRSVVIPALLFVQKQNGGWLNQAVMDALAAYLELEPIIVYEIATFYDMYHLEPIGKNKISVCTNISCYLNGSDEIMACLKKRLGIDVDETTPDGLFTLKTVECMAACGGAPMCQINDQAYHENLTPQKMLAIVDQLAKESL